MFKVIHARFLCTSSRLRTPYIQLAEPGTAGIIILNRPSDINAINHEMSEYVENLAILADKTMCYCFREIYQSLKKFEATKTHVVMKGAGGRSFSVGRDMRDIIVNPLSVVKERFRNEYRSFYLLAEYKKPFVALIDGVCMGGACGFSMCGKFRVATERTSVAMPETSIGFFGANGSSYWLSRLRNHVGIYLSLTGARLRGFDLKKVGLATHFVESKKLKALEKDLEYVSHSDDVSKILAGYSAIPMTMETEFDEQIPRIQECFDARTVEEIIGNLKKDDSKWSRETIAALNLKSPTSLKVCHRLLYLGKMLTWKQCLKMEFRIAVQHTIESDMREGCRAMFVDKDENPMWNPKTLDEVTKEQVERFFGPVPDGDELKFGKPENKL